MNKREARKFDQLYKKQTKRTRIPISARKMIVFCTEIRVSAPLFATQKPIIRCQQCQCATHIIDVTPKRIPINFRFMRTMTANE